MILHYLMTPIGLQFLYKKRYICSHYFLLPKNYQGLFQQNVSLLQIDMVNQEIFILFNISSRFLPNHALYICSKGETLLSGEWSHRTEKVYSLHPRRGRGKRLWDVSSPTSHTPRRKRHEGVSVFMLNPLLSVKQGSVSQFTFINIVCILSATFIFFIYRNQ